MGEVEWPNATRCWRLPSPWEKAAVGYPSKEKNTNFPFEIVCSDAFECLHQCEERPLSLTKVGYVPRPAGSDTRVDGYCILSDT